MKNSPFSKMRLTVILGLFFCLLQATWIPFEINSAEQTPDIKLVSSNEFSLILEVNIYGAELKEFDTRQITDIGNEIFNYLSIGEYAFTSDIGKPKLPMVTSVLDVPHQAQINIEVISTDYKEIDLTTVGVDKRIIPALASVPKIPGARAKFVIDEKTYATDAFYPNRIANIEEHADYARGHRLATLQLFPIQYNPVTNRIRCYTNIQVKIDFLGGNIMQTQQIIEKNHSKIWEDFIKKMVVNYPHYLKDPPPLPIYYDIFYNNAFSEAAESLAYWKNKKGYKVRKWDATGWSANAIDDTIEAQTPLATFLVIIGDPNSSTPLPPWGNGSSTHDQTDLYYAETDGSGYLPDMFNARISVLDATQANIAIQKALRYEHANFGSAGFNWLRKACFVAGYDPYGMQSVGMATNWYCRNLLDSHGYTVDTLCISSGEQEGRIVSAINDGRAWCVYTAHGSQTVWAVGYYSSFTIPEVQTLTNLDMYPMPCGHCCLTGDYQYGTHCFGETWDRLDGKGGICYFGSVESSYWDEDDWLQRRYFDALYGSSVPGNLHETGRFTQWGLYWIELNTGSSLKRWYFESYHLFNDPSLDFWTDIPDSMSVNHDSIAGPSSGNFTVTVLDNDGITPLENALVCCWIVNQIPEMHVSDYTDASGQATLPVSPTTIGDTMYVTATKHNYLPYEGYAVIDPAGIKEDIDISGTPVQSMLITLYPNPFQNKLIIKYSIGHSAKDAVLAIYNSAGQLVKRYDYTTMRLSDKIVWDGCDDSGRKVPAGLYFVRFQAGDYDKIEKMILLK